MPRLEIGPTIRLWFSTKFHFKWTTTLTAKRLHNNMLLFHVKFQKPVA